MGVEILSGAISGDHVHMLVSVPPQVSVSKVVQKIKGKSSYKMQRELAQLRKEYWGQRMWGRRYFACSMGNVTDDMIRQYIEGHRDREDSFHVSDE
jgi:putative transposase